MKFLSNLLGRIFPRKEKDEGLAMERDLAKEKMRTLSEMPLEAFTDEFTSLLVFSNRRGSLAEADMCSVFKTRQYVVEEQKGKLRKQITDEETHIATSLHNADTLCKNAIISEVSSPDILDVEFITSLASFMNASREAIKNKDVWTFMLKSYPKYRSIFKDFETDDKRVETVNNITYRLDRINKCATKIKELYKSGKAAEADYQHWAKFVVNNHINLEISGYISEDDVEKYKEYIDS